MNLKKIRFIVLFMLIVFIMIPVSNRSFGATRVLSPKVYQHLDIGVTFGHEGDDWGKEDYLSGRYYTISTGISFGSDIKLLEAYPLVGNEAKFNFFDFEHNSHNIREGYSFPLHYAPYSASLSNIVTSVDGNQLNWSYRAHLSSPRKMGVVSIVKKYKGISGGLELAKEEIYGPLGGEDLVRRLYSRSYHSIEKTVNNAFNNNVGNNDVILYFCPIVFKYQKYVEVEDVHADLDAPYHVKKGSKYKLKDISQIDKNLMVSEGILEKEIDGKFHELVRWQGQGIYGANTGGIIEENAEKEGSVKYRFTIKTTTGQQAQCMKTVLITDDKAVDAKAVLMVPEYSYEGHEFKVYDFSEFEVDGKYMHPQAVYDDKLARNYYHSVADKVVRDQKDANMTFMRRGDYPITLEVVLKGGQRLYDTKRIEIRKTPYLDLRIGGVQKQNRKQSVNADVVTAPGHDIVEYTLEIRDKTTGEICRISQDKTSYVGSGIKTGKAILTKDSEYESHLTMDFLTKYPNYYETGNENREYEYKLTVKDTKGDTDTQSGSISVRPDLPPKVKINMQESFLRGEGSNKADLTAEDASQSDGDVFVRNWYVKEMSAADDTDSGFENISSMEDYADLSMGTKQSIRWKKEGVGRFRVKLSVKEQWMEETLPEFISEEDYLKGEGTCDSEVLNIAPKVSITPLESSQIDLVIIGSEEEIEEKKKQENTLQARLIEKGLDAKISYVRFREQKESNQDYKRLSEVYYSGGTNNSLSDSVYMLSCEDNYYTMQCDTYKHDQRERGRAPYQIRAHDAITGKTVWSFVVNEDDCVASVAQNGKYFLISSEKTMRTQLLDRKTGQFIGGIPIFVKGKIFTDVSGERIYIVGNSGISMYNVSGNSLKKISKDKIFLPRLQEGKLAFIGKKGQLEFYYAVLNFETEELIKMPFPDIKKELSYKNQGDRVEYPEIEPVDMDSNGKVIFSAKKWTRLYTYLDFGAWLVEKDKNSIRKLYQRRIRDVNRVIDVGGIRNEQGEFTEYYLNSCEYDSASNRRYGSVEISIFKNGVPKQVFRKSKTKYSENSEVILAQKHSGKNEYHIIKGGDCNEFKLQGTVELTVDAAAVENLNKRDFSAHVLGGCENYFEQDDYALLGVWYDYYSSDRKALRTHSLPYSNSQILWKSFNKRVNLRSGVSRFVLPLNEKVRGFLEENSNAKKEIIVLENSEIKELGEEIEEHTKREVGMLSLKKGGNDAAIAKVRSNAKLNINNKYNYEYILYKKAETAEDILKIVNLDSDANLKQYKRILERQEFTAPYEQGFINFKGGMMGANKHSRYKGFGGLAGPGRKSASFDLDFDMPKDGYIKYDMWVSLENRDNAIFFLNNGRYIVENWDTRTSLRNYTHNISKGKQKFEFRGSAYTTNSCELAMKNIEIGCMENKKNMALSSEVKKIGNGKFLVSGQFNAISENVMFELSNDGETEIKISDFKVYGKKDGETEIEEIYNQEFSEKKDCGNWKFVAGKGGEAQIVKSKRQTGELEGDLMYKKGQLVRYKVNYKDYEDDPSKKEYWLYIHTPYNDGKHPNAFAFRNLDGTYKEVKGEMLAHFEKEDLVALAKKNNKYIYNKPIDRFYIDGKYTVLHWQEDNTSRGDSADGNPDYDKMSNICEITFYIEGSANAPWIKNITTAPSEVEAGRGFSINVEIDDLEKEKLSLITEVYKEGVRIFIHKKDHILPDEYGNYPIVNTGTVTAKAESGVYKVICTVSDGSAVGTGKYDFVVKDCKDIKGTVMHTSEWEKNRKKYNEKVCKIENDQWLKLSEYLKLSKPRPRARSVFWAGESFVLKAEVLGKAHSVKCRIEGTSYSVNLKKTSTEGEKDIFTGKLWKSSMKKDWAGREAVALRFVFTAEYDDGEILEFVENVIIDDSNDFRKLHRKW